MKMGGRFILFPRNDTKIFIYKGFRKNMGTGFTFCLALNVRKQKKTVPILKLPLQECPLNARKVPLPAFASISFEPRAPSNFRKTRTRESEYRAITTPVFGLFLPPQNHETLIKESEISCNVKYFIL
jgi:hypothetical protein